MNDEKIDKIQAEIDRLEKAKEDRIKALADPKRQEIRRLWEQLKSTIDQLDSLGEDIETDDGDTPTLRGATFRMNYDGEIIES